MEIHNLTRDAEVFTANAYLVIGERNVMVDVGTVSEITKSISNHVDVLHDIYVTHQHHDHVEELAAVCDRFDPVVHSYAAHPRQDRSLTDGQEVIIGEQPFDVVHTPGHAEDHVSFLGERSLFSGDVVVYNDGAFEDGSFGRTDHPGQSREDLIESLNTLLNRLPAGLTKLYPGHGNEFEGDVREVIERALKRAERREPKYQD